MSRSRSMAFALAMVASLLLGGTAVGAAPVEPSGGTWVASNLGVVPRDPCVPAWGLAECTRPGGLAAVGLATTLVHMDRWSGELGAADFALVQRSANGGVSFGAGDSLADTIEGPDQTELPALAQRGMDLDVIFDRRGAFRPIQLRHSTNLGQTWGPARTFKRPRQVTTNLAVARGPGGRVAFAFAGFDELPAGRPAVAIEVRVSEDGGVSYPVSKRIAWTVPFCFLSGTDPSIAITNGGTIVLAYWKTCSKLLVRRSTDGGHTWSSPKRLSSGTHTMGMAMAARNNELVLAYTAAGRTLTRHSSTQGGTWSAPVNAGSGAESLRLVHGGGAWRLLSGGSDRIRYRTSVNGTTWSGGETVAESIGSRTYAVGVAYGVMPLAAYVIRTSDGVHRAWVARRP